MVERAAPDRGHRRLRDRDTYGILLVLILLTYLAMALLESTLWDKFLLALMLGGVMLLALYASHAHRRLFLVGIALVTISVVNVLVQAIAGREGSDGSTYVMFVLVLIAPVVILNRIMRHPVINLQTILGAICVYVLLGLAFAGIYAGVNDFESAGFFAQHVVPSNVDFLYFSFVTITTTGFGDLTAGTDIGKVLVTFEALMGQIFLVTLVARLVSGYGTERRRVAAAAGDAGGDSSVGSDVEE